MRTSTPTPQSLLLGACVLIAACGCAPGPGDAGATSSSSSSSSPSSGSGTGASQGNGASSSSVSSSGAAAASIRVTQKKVIWHGQEDALTGVVDGFQAPASSAPAMPASGAMCWPGPVLPQDLAFRWSIIRARPSDHCATSDIQLGVQEDTRGPGCVPFSSIRARVPDDHAKRDCVYTYQLEADGLVADTGELGIRSIPPRVVLRDGWETPGGLAMAALDTTTVPLEAGIDPSDITGTLEWGGRDANLVDNGWLVGAAPGDYALTVTLRDGRTPTVSTDVAVHVRACVWVSTTMGTGDGSGSSPDNPMDSLQAALNAASQAPFTAVCSMGAQEFAEDVTIPSTPYAPDIHGGIRADGLLLDIETTIVSPGAGGVAVEPGYTGLIRHVAFRQDASVVHAGAAAALTLRSAAPTLVQSVVHGGAGNPAYGVVVETAAGPSRPVFSRGYIHVGRETLQEGVAIDVRSPVVGDVTLATLGTNASVDGACTGGCTGLRAHPDATVVVRGGWISVNAGSGSATGVDARGTDGHPVHADLRGRSVLWDGAMVSAVTVSGASAVAVGLAHTVDAHVENLSAWASGGTRLSAAVADGSVDDDGTWVPGMSTGLVVRGNMELRGTRGTSCAGAGVGAGVLLVGTRSVTLVDNGERAMEHAFRAPNDPPRFTGTPALWLVGTEDVLVSGNTLGTERVAAGQDCTPAMPPLQVAAFVDGDGRDGAHATAGTVAAGNAFHCDATWSRVPVTCDAVRVVGADQASAPLLLNNFLHATNAGTLHGLRVSGGHGVVAIHNTILVDSSPVPPGAPAREPETVTKRAVLLEDVDARGLSLQNNLLLVHADDDDAVASRVGILDVTSTAQVPALQGHLDVFDSNLFSVGGGADACIPTCVTLADPASSLDLGAGDLDAIPGVPPAPGNAVADVRLLHLDHAETSSLQVPSPAEGAASPVVLVTSPHLAKDIDGDPRPSTLGDVGCDEVHP